MSALNGLADTAETYCRAGWKLVPVAGKVPAVGGANWQKKATSDFGTLKKSWSRGADGIGILLGERSGIIDIECDGPEAEAKLAELFADEGFPVCPTFQSTRGKHRIFQWRAGLPAVAKFETPEKLEFRIGNETAQSVFPPSGGRTWLVPPDDCPPPPISDAIAQRICELYAPTRARPAKPAGNRILTEGKRNNGLFKLASSLRARGLSESGILAALLEENAGRCNPPLEECEVESIARSAGKYPEGGQNNGKAGEAPLAILRADQQTDLANARRFVELHGRDVRYCHPWKKWLVWDGRRWKIDDDGTPIRLAKDVADDIWKFACECDAPTLRKFAAQSAGRQRIEAMLALAQSEVPVLPSDLDCDPWLLNCPNGTVELRTGKRRQHRREEFITKLCPTEFDPDAGSYAWDRFQEDVTDGNGALIEFKRRFYGYCATGNVSEQILPIFYGTGANGKSTELEAITGTLGPDYSGAAPKDLLMMKRGESHPTEIADLHGMRLVIAQETEHYRTLNESLVKSLTGGDAVKARRMREDFWQFQPTHKLILCTNHKPRVKGTDHAIWRRLRLVPFVVKFDGDRRDKSMPEKLRAERAGILAWIVRGAVDWHAGGLCEPECVRLATEEYRSSQDLIAEFIADCCTLGESLWTPSAQLLEAFEKWCKERGEQPPRGKTFAEGLERHNCKRSRNSTARGWQGIGLLSETAMTL